MNDNDIESKIIAILSTGQPVRTQRLVGQLRSNKQDLRGFSEATIYRKIKKLSDRGRILTLSSDELKPFGIIYDDKRAHYLILSDYNDRKKHLDSILKYLDSGDVGDAIIVFDELERYGYPYVLTPAQLNKLIPGKTTDFTVIYPAIRILREYICRKHILPSDKPRLLRSLKQTLNRIGNENTQNWNIEGYCLEILGFLGDDYVIEQLMIDADNQKRLEHVKNTYESQYLVRVIENARDRLFEFERSLAKRGKNDSEKEKIQAILKVIRDIRTTATHRVFSPPPDFQDFSFELSDNTGH
jgi:hypothetical protein